MRSILEKVGRIVVAALIVLSISELAFFLTVRRHTQLYSTDESFPEPSGYMLDNQYLAPHAARCYLIRVSSDSCPYCRLDQARYSRLVQEAKTAGCEAVILAPMSGQMKLENESPSIQLQYVDMSFGRVLKPVVTPETILLNRRGRPIWQQAGAIDENDLALALRALAGLR